VLAIRANVVYVISVSKYAPSVSRTRVISLPRPLLRSSLRLLNVRQVIYTRGFTAREILRKALTRTETSVARRVARRRCASSENEKSFFTARLRATCARVKLSEMELSGRDFSVFPARVDRNGGAAENTRVL